MLGASDFKVIDLTFKCSVKNVVEVLFAAVRACCLLLLEPVLEAGLTEVLSTADGELRVTESLCADTAIEPVRNWLGKCEVISTILSLFKDVCYCHFGSVRLKSVVCGCRKNDN